MRKQLRLSGSGGQGVITAAIILAEAAVAEGKEAAQSQSYGPEARGGASKAEVIIDTETIYHPHVIHPDLVLAMTQKAADKYYEDIVPGGLLVLDEQLVPNPPDFPKTALGALVRLTDIVSFDTIKESVAHRVPKHTVEQNMHALQVGWEAADKLA